MKPSHKLDAAVFELRAGQSFDDELHEYRHRGERVPSVTEVIRALGLGPDFTRVLPSVLETAAWRGQYVHSMLRARLQESHTVDSTDHWLEDEWSERVDEAAQLLEQVHLCLWAAETPLISSIVRLGGTPDLYGSIVDDHRWAVIEVKTGAQDGADIQLSMYSMLLRERAALAGVVLNPPELYVLGVPSRGHCSLRPVDAVPDGILRSLVEAHHFIERRRTEWTYR